MSIRFRPDRKKWELCVVIEGKRKRLLFSKKKEAALHSEKQSGDSRPSETNERDVTTIDHAITAYYKSRSAEKARTSMKNERLYFNLMFNFLVGSKRIAKLDQVQYGDMLELQNWLKRPQVVKGRHMHWSPATVNRAFNSIRDFWIHWVRSGTLKASPCAYLANLPEQDNSRRPMTEDEYLLTFRKAPEWFKPAMIFMYLTASAPSSVERLVWSDVDFGARSVLITRRKGAKAKWRRFPFPMIDSLLEILLSHREDYPIAKAGDAVFRNEHGHRLTGAWCSRVGNRAIRAAGIDGVQFYGMRHALASDLADANVNMEIVRQLMGHANIRTTQRYAKPKTESLAVALRLVRDACTPPGTPPAGEDIACGGKVLERSEVS